MGMSVKTVTSGGMPVVDVTATKPALGVSVTEAAGGMAVTKVSLAVGGLPVTFVLAGNEWPPSGGGGGTTYATWDPATVTAVTLSGGNLVATATTSSTSSEQGARVATASGKTSGKYYFEVVRDTVSGSSNMTTGVGTTTSTYTGMGGGTRGVVGAVVRTTGAIYINGVTSPANIGTLVSASKIGIAVDLDNRTIWFRKQPGDNWNNSATANPATNVEGLAVPAGTMVPFATLGGAGGTIGEQWTANFGTSVFTGTVPSGFTSGWPA